jgi:ribosome-binding ATPase YchF (GTP1/OBG family)
MLADLESLEKRVKQRREEAPRPATRRAPRPCAWCSWPSTELNAGRPARKAKVDAEDDKAWRMLQLLTSKPALYVCNVDEGSADKGNEMSEAGGRARAPATAPKTW